MKGKLTREGLGLLFLKVVNISFTLALSILLARILGPDDFGVYAFTISLVMTLAIPVQIGFPQLIVRETSICQTHRNWSLVRGLWHWSTTVTFIYSVLIILIVITILIFQRNSISGQKYITIFWALPLIPIVTMLNIRSASLRGLQRIVISQLPESLLRPGLMIIFVATMYIFRQVMPITSKTIVTSHLCSSLCVLLFATFLLRRSLPIELKACKSIKYKKKYWLNAALPIALISGFHFLTRHTDILMIGFIRSDEEVGIYRIAAQASLLLSFGPQILNILFAPYIASFYSKYDYDRLQKIAKLIAQLGFCCSLLVLIFFLIFGKFIITQLFGSEFQPSYIPLLILAGGLTINAGFGQAGMLLQMTGHERITLFGVFVAAIVNIIINLFLIPIIGINGAAFSTSIALIVSHGILIVFVFKKIKIDGTALPFLLRKHTK